MDFKIQKIKQERKANNEDTLELKGPNTVSESHENKSKENQSTGLEH